MGLMCIIACGEYILEMCVHRVQSEADEQGVWSASCFQIEMRRTKEKNEGVTIIEDLAYIAQDYEPIHLCEFYTTSDEAHARFAALIKEHHHF